MSKNPIQKNGERPLEVRLPHAPLPTASNGADHEPMTGKFTAGNTAASRRVAKFQTDVMHGMLALKDEDAANVDPLLRAWFEYAKAYMRGLMATLPVQNDGTCALARECAKFSALGGYFLARAVRDTKLNLLAGKDFDQAGRWFDRHGQSLVRLAALAALPTGQKGDGGVADLTRRLDAINVAPPPEDDKH